MPFVHPTIPHADRFRPDGTPYRNAEPWRPALAARRAARAEFQRRFAAERLDATWPRWRFAVRYEEVGGVEARCRLPALNVLVRTTLAEWKIEVGGAAGISYASAVAGDGLAAALARAIARQQEADARLDRCWAGSIEGRPAWSLRPHELW